VRKREGVAPLARQRYLWEDDIETKVTYIRWKGVGRTDLAQDSEEWLAVVKRELKLLFP
jgi:hypothetical protein